MHGTGTPGAGGTLSGNITIEGTSPGGSGFRFFSTPVNSAPANLFGSISGGPDGAYFIPDPTCLYSDPSSPYANQMQYDESVVTYCRHQGWQMKTAGTLQNGRGYAFNVPSAGYILSASGTPNNGNVTYSGLTNGANPSVLSNGNPVQGFNMLGNPYPSPISWDDFRASNTNLGIAAYVYNNGTWNTLIAGGAEDFIPPYQGFQVIYTGGPSSATFANSHRRAVSGLSLYSNPNFAEMLTIKATGGNLTDYSMIYFDENATPDFNHNHDAYKMQNDAGFITVYTKIPGTENRLFLNGLPHPETDFYIPLGMIPSESGTYTLDFEGFSTLNPSMLIFLEDIKTGHIQLLNQNPSYTFIMESTENTDRFLLRMSAPINVIQTVATCDSKGSLTLQSPATSWSYSITGNGVSFSGILNQDVINYSLENGDYQITFVNPLTQYSFIQNIQIQGATPITGGILSSTDQVNVNEPFQVFANTNGAESFYWDFGDGTTSTEANPVHTYTMMTTYKISLRASNQSGCEVTDVFYMKAFDANMSLDNQPIEALSAGIFPNPTKESFTLELTNSGIFIISIIDLNGKTIMSQSLYSNHEKSIHTIDVSGLSKGVYTIRLNQSENFRYYKLVIF
jgi:hypothetical protein